MKAPKQLLGRNAKFKKLAQGLGSVTRRDLLGPLGVVLNLRPKRGPGRNRGEGLAPVRGGMLKDKGRKTGGKRQCEEEASKI